MAKSSSASSSLSSASSAASSALSKTSKAASAVLSASSKSASSAASSASAKASAAARDAAGYPPSTSDKLYTGLTITGVIITVLALAVAGLYFSGYADDLFVYYAKKFYKAKAKAEVTALEHVGEGKAEGFLKDQLKKNPIMGEDELEQVQKGLGVEASAQGLGGVSEKLGGLGGLGGLGKL